MDYRGIHFNDLPNLVLHRIFVNLPSLADRAVLSLVCQQWNEVAFDYSFLDHIRITLKLCTPTTITRYYQSIRIYRQPDLTVEEKNVTKILTSFEKVSSSLKELIYDAPLDFLTLKILSTCPRLVKLVFRVDMVVPDGFNDQLPVLENLKELHTANLSDFDVIRVAPNLRTLRISRSIYNFSNWTKETKLTAVELSFDSENLAAELIQFCPLLTKLRFRQITLPLRPLASLTHLKILSLCINENPFEMLINENSVFPNVEILEIVTDAEVIFDTLQHLFPRVHYLKINWHEQYHMPETRNRRLCFPQLRTLEVMSYKTEALLDLLAGLCNLRTLILHSKLLLSSHLPPMNGLQQLTLHKAGLTVTKEMDANFPSLQVLNLYTGSNYYNKRELPSRITVRRYRKNFCKDIFDVIP